MLVEEEREGRAFTGYHLAHRRRARELTGLPFDLPAVGTPYPRSSLPALEAARWVELRYPERLDAFDITLFEAFFRDTRDIADPQVLASLASDLGLDGEELRSSLARREHRPEVWEEYEDALRSGVRSIPTVRMGGQVITGAVPLEEYGRAAGAALSGK